MRRVLLLLLALAGCSKDDTLSRIQNETDAINAHTAARFLLVHWPNGGPDFVREYSNEGACEAGRAQILRAASEATNLVDAVNDTRRRGTSPPLPLPPQPIAACLLE